MEARKARDRFSTTPKRNKRGRPIVAALTERQPRILQALAEHGTLTVYDIHAIVGGELRSLRESIRVLKDEPNEYIRIIPEQLRTRNLRENLCYQLAPRGVEWLNANGGHVQQPGRVYNLSHATLVSHIMASLNAGISQQPGARLVSWEEMQTHPKFPKESVGKDYAIFHPKTEHKIRPDTPPFAIELPKDGKLTYTFIVIEADNGTESVETRIREKIEAYLHFIETKGFHEHFGIPNFYVLFVFTNQARVDTTKRKVLEPHGGSRNIAFQVANREAPPGYIFTTPCERSGHEPLHLNKR